MDSTTSLRVSAHLKNLTLIRRFIEQGAAALGASPEAVDDLVLAVDEAVTNVIIHGYHSEPGTIDIELRREGDMLVILLGDQAPPFDPNTVPPPDISVPLERRPFGGLGVHLMRLSVDEFQYQAGLSGRNVLTLRKRLTARQDS